MRVGAGSVRMSADEGQETPHEVTTSRTGQISSEMRSNIVSLLERIFEFHETIAGRTLSAITYAKTPMCHTKEGAYIVYNPSKNIQFISPTSASVRDRLDWLPQVLEWACEDGLVTSENANQYFRPRARSSTPQGLPACTVDSNAKRSSASFPDRAA